MNNETTKQKLLDWIKNYLVEEDFPAEYLNALTKIIVLFNDCKESEREIFEFAEKLYKKYAE